MEKFINLLNTLDLYLIEEKGELTLHSYSNLNNSEIDKILGKNIYITYYIQENRSNLIRHLKGENTTKKNVVLDKNNIEAIYELSPVQEGLLFHYLYNPDSNTYLEQFVLDVSTQLNIESFNLAWQYVINNHSILRTGFVYDKINRPLQYVYKNVQVPLFYLELDHLSQLKIDDKIKEYIEKDKLNTFDLNFAPLMRVSVLKTGKNSYKIIWTHHHILLDGWSVPMLMLNLLKCYQKLLCGQKPENHIDNYSDYIKYLNSRDIKDEKFWQSYVQNIESATLLPFIKNIYDRNKGIGHINNIILKCQVDLTSGIKNYVKKHHITASTLLQGVWSLVLSKYTQQKTVTIGVVVSGRPSEFANIEDKIGIYANTLPLYISIDNKKTISSFLTDIQNNYSNVVEYQYTSLAKIQSFTSVKGDLFDTLFAFENYPVSNVLFDRSSSLSIDKIDIFEKTNYPLTIVTSLLENLEVSFNYNESLLSFSTVQMIKKHFKTLLEQIVLENKSNLSDLDIITHDEKQIILHQDDLLIEIPKQTIIDLFNYQVKINPNKTALAFGDTKLTYSELNRKATLFAHKLITDGVKKETFVGICIERTSEMIIGMLAILKCGAAYVPIDTKYPKERIRYIIDDAEINYIITNYDSKQMIFSERELNIIIIDETKLIGISTPQFSVAISGNDAAYIIYTSGTTGKPKGVIVEHKNIASLIKSTNEKFEFTHEDIWTLFHSFCFDFSVWEIFGCLTSGGKLIIVPEDIVKDTSLFCAMLREENVTILNQTPSAFSSLLQVTEDKQWQFALRYIIFGGEALYPNTLSVWYSKYPDIKLINMYGITETTIHTTFKELTAKDIASEISNIGKPLSNLYIYILDEDRKILPEGIAGEICIGGIGVARGYWNREELTNEKFIENPYRKGERLYCSGDLGRWINNNRDIEYIGRKDNQVKIRGFRVELGEIEAAINELDIVDSNCTILERNEYSDNLVTYYVPNWYKLKEVGTQLYNNRINNWQSIYDEEYNNIENGNEEFNITGWIDSFSGKPIPENEMQEWLQDIMNIILKDNPESVLEIGCGTGLIYYQLAKHITKYIGYDISSKAINQIKHRIERKEKNYPDTFLYTGEANDIKLDKKEKIDTIIINSVIQYFPSDDYLLNIIRKSLSFLKGKGKIIIGDVRDFRLLKYFRCHILTGNLSIDQSMDDFLWILDKEVLNDEELCLSPDFFYNLKNLFPQISHIEIVQKKGQGKNEMILYRFNVVIYVGISKEVYQPDWIDWNTIIDKAEFLNQIKDTISPFAIKNFPNPRLFKTSKIKEGLSQNILTTEYFLDHINSSLSQEMHLANKMLSIIQKNEYQYEMYLNENPLEIDLFFSCDSCDRFIITTYSEKKSYDKNISNFPLFNEVSLELNKELKHQLSAKLPSYMVPSNLCTIHKMPLTINGKTDKSKLQNKVNIDNTQHLSNYIAPVTQTEIQLAKIWKELLNLKNISTIDNFFEKGGHSLLAVRLISSIRKYFDVDLSIKDLFENPTIKGISLLIEHRHHSLNYPEIQKYTHFNKIPLSYSQERLWFIDKLHGSENYHIPVKFHIKGDLNKEMLEASLRLILFRHETLRTVIKEDPISNNLYQEILNEDDWSLQYENITDFAQTQELTDYILSKPFDLTKDFMLKALLINQQNSEHLLFIVIHHIAADGWSMPIFLNELTELYSSLQEERPSRLSQLPIRFADFAQWQRDYMQNESVFYPKLKYWENKLKGHEILNLPTDFIRPSEPSKKGKIFSFTIEKEINFKLTEFSRREGVTQFMLLLSVFKILLYRYTGQEDISVGTPIANRVLKEVEPLIGYFVNTLVLRSSITGSYTFREFLQKIKETTLSAYENQDVPFDLIVDKIKISRDLSRNPLFQVMFVLQNNENANVINFENLSFSSGSVKNNTSKFDLYFEIYENNNQLNINIEYSTDLFSEDTIKRLSKHYRTLLQSAVLNPNQKISSLEILNPEEKQLLLKEFNNTLTEFPMNKSVIDLFQEQVEKNPDKIAIVCNKQKISYLDLNKFSNQFSHYLMKNYLIRKNDLIGIKMTNSENLIIAIIGILKAGGAYVPIDMDYPINRCNYIINNSNTKLIIDNSVYNDFFNNKEAYSTDSTKVTIIPSDLIYVIHTSGTTGNPKGIMMEHINMMNLICFMNKFFKEENVQSVLQFNNISFDVSFQEIFSTLTYGSTLYLIDQDLKKDPYSMVNFLTDSDIDTLFLPTAYFKVLTENADICMKLCDKVRNIIVAGEQLILNDSIIEELKKQKIKLYNHYGPAETHVVTTHLIDVNKDINRYPSIGKPISNTSLFILDDNMNILPINAVGHLYIGGLAVSRGYINQPDITNDKFIQNPFNSNHSKLYNSGDLARWLHNGNIEYIGRKDKQVKIKGYRVEISEIESVLQKCPTIKQNVVIIREDSTGNKILLAFIVPFSNFNPSEIKIFAKNELPEYMTPSAYIEIDKIPITSNGKTDKDALIALAKSHNDSREYTPPETILEKEIFSIWQEILGIDRIGIHDNFFELGGNSINAIRVINKINSKYNCNIGIKNLFISQTIKDLCTTMEMIMNNAKTITINEDDYDNIVI